MNEPTRPDQPPTSGPPPLVGVPATVLRATIDILDLMAQFLRLHADYYVYQRVCALLAQENPDIDSGEAAEALVDHLDWYALVLDEALQAAQAPPAHTQPPR